MGRLGKWSSRMTRELAHVYLSSTPPTCPTRVLGDNSYWAVSLDDAVGMGGGCGSECPPGMGQLQPEVLRCPLLRRHGGPLLSKPSGNVGRDEGSAGYLPGS